MPPKVLRLQRNEGKERKHNLLIGSNNPNPNVVEVLFAHTWTKMLDLTKLDFPSLCFHIG